MIGRGLRPAGTFVVLTTRGAMNAGEPPPPLMLSFTAGRLLLEISFENASGVISVLVAEVPGMLRLAAKALLERFDSDISALAALHGIAARASRTSCGVW